MPLAVVNCLLMEVIFDEYESYGPSMSWNKNRKKHSRNCHLLRTEALGRLENYLQPPIDDSISMNTSYFWSSIKSANLEL